MYYPEDKSRFDNLISYLLLEDTPDIFTNGDLETTFSCDPFIPTIEAITTDKVYKYVISNNIVGTIKYIDGFYYENNQYYVYHHQEMADNNPFAKEPNQLVGLDDPLYGYYQSIVS